MRNKKEIFELIDRLMDYDHCHDGDVDEAAECLRELADRLEYYEPELECDHFWYFGRCLKCGDLFLAETD